MAGNPSRCALEPPPPSWNFLTSKLLIDRKYSETKHMQRCIMLADAPKRESVYRVVHTLITVLTETTETVHINNPLLQRTV